MIWESFFSGLCLKKSSDDEEEKDLFVSETVLFFTATGAATAWWTLGKLAFPKLPPPFWYGLADNGESGCGYDSFFFLPKLPEKLRVFKPAIILIT